MSKPTNAGTAERDPNSAGMRTPTGARVAIVRGAEPISRDLSARSKSRKDAPYALPAAPAGHLAPERRILHRRRGQGTRKPWLARQRPRSRSSPQAEVLERAAQVTEGGISKRELDVLIWHLKREWIDWPWPARRCFGAFALRAARPDALRFGRVNWTSDRLSKLFRSLARLGPLRDELRPSAPGSSIANSFDC